MSVIVDQLAGAIKPEDGRINLLPAAKIRRGSPLRSSSSGQLGPSRRGGEETWTTHRSMRRWCISASY